jgi:hypothetical protein
MMITWQFGACGNTFSDYERLTQSGANFLKFIPYCDDSTCNEMNAMAMNVVPASLDCKDTVPFPYQVMCVPATPGGNGGSD